MAGGKGRRRDAIGAVAPKAAAGAASALGGGASARGTAWRTSAAASTWQRSRTWDLHEWVVQVRNV